MEKFWQGFIAFTCSIITYLFGGWTALLNILFFLIIFDFFTGVASAFYKKEVSSKVGLIGITKKALIIGIVALAHQFDIIFNTESIFMDTFIYFYSANELLSIIENFGKLNIPLPKIIKSAVKILNTQEKLNNKGE